MFGQDSRKEKKKNRNFEVVQTVFTLLQTWHRKNALTDFILQKWKKLPETVSQFV